MSDEQKVDGQDPNLQEAPEEKVEDNTDTPEEVPAEPEADTPAAIDYETKFSESSKEGIRLHKENEELKAKLEERTEPDNYNNDSESLYPGFEDLGEAEQKNLISYTDGIRKRAVEDIYKDPAIAHAQESYNKQRWNEALNKTLDEYPQLKDNRADFESKYYNKNNVPENIGEIVGDMAKIYLFDSAKDIGSQDAIEQQKRIDIERSKGGGNQDPGSTRTLEDWSTMAQNNPAKFAQMSKEYNADLDAGKL